MNTKFHPELIGLDFKYKDAVIISLKTLLDARPNFEGEV